MKKNLAVQWAGVVCLLAGLAWGGTVAVNPASKTYLQTELTIGTPVSLPISLSDWGGTNIVVSASGGGAIFDASVSPAGSAPQTTTRTLWLTPEGNAGSTTVDVSVDAGGGPSLASASVSLTVTPVPVLSGLSATATFNEDTTYTDGFSVTYWGNANDLTWSAVIVTGGAVLSTATISGSGLSRSLVLTPVANENGSASVRVTVTDGTQSATQLISVTVSGVPDAPVVTGLPATLSFNEDTSMSEPFTVQDLDAGTSGAISSTASLAAGPATLLSSYSVSGTTLQLTPYANAYGWTTVRVVTANSVLATTNLVQVKVQPVADAPAVSSWPTSPIELSVGGTPASLAFSAPTVSDADHQAFKNGSSNEYLKASAGVDAGNILFSAGAGATSSTNLGGGLIPAGVTSWVRSLSLYPPESSYMPVGRVSTNTLTLHVYGFGSNDVLSVTRTVPVLLINPNHLPSYIPTASPNALQEGQTITPFSISQLVDQDAVHTVFSLRLFVKPEDSALAALSTSGLMSGNESELKTQLNNVGLSAANGVMSSLTTNVTVYFVLSDSIDYVTNAVTMTIHQITTAPVINGINELTAFYSISDIETVTPFPTVITYDTDQGGQQQLRASVAVSEPGLGGFLDDVDATAYITNILLTSQSDLETKLRQLIFKPVAGALAIGTSDEVTLTLTVTDATGLSSVNNRTRVLITAVNKPPRIAVPQVQPLLLPPGGDLRPFAGTTVTNDDTNSVSMVITLDNNDKGTLENLGGFTFAGGQYTMSGTIAALNAALTNMVYAVNPVFAFSPDDPGGTVFTLEAEDYQVKLGSGQVWVQIQEGPRNHLVTKTANDGTPGSLLFALAHLSNNDVITFALPEYPAVIRVPESFGPLVLGTSLTLKGPGADLLTISGDADGDGDADGQIFVVQSRVTIEGVTLARGHATFGGAASVAPAGALTLRACALVDCEAEEYGGAIDVEGKLLLEGCFLARNRVTATGFGGGAVSFYTSSDASIVNTTFASNRVDNAGGYGGGALYVERDAGPVNVAVTHCTFAGNSDASHNGSAVYVVGGNSYATLKNNIFSDYSEADGARNIDVTGDGWVVTEGGNVCDDSTRTAYLQAGGTSVYLLTHTGDRTSVAPGLGGLARAEGDVLPSYPLQAGSPARQRAQGVGATTDQRERIRRHDPRDSGAVQQDATERVVITEIQLSSEPGDTDQFIEVYVPRDGQTVDLSGFSLYVNGTAVHTFGQGYLALTNSVYTNLAAASSVSASYVLAPGRGVVIAFPRGPVADFGSFSQLNPTPVVRASIATNAAALGSVLSAAGRGSVAIAKSAADAPIVSQTYLTVFIDPDSESGTNLLETTHNSIASAPQGRGFAFLPHSSVSPEMYGGWRGRPAVIASSVFLQSPGATVDGTPFGLPNATPLAVGDAVTLTEDDVGLLDVLGNDLDADGNDRLAIVDVSTASGPYSGDDASALSQLGAAVAITPSAAPLRGVAVGYDPRDAAALQALPAGVEILDTFYYEIIDFGSASVDGIAGGTSSNTWVTALNHRLTTGETVALSGVSVPAYNGAFAIAVIDADTFAIPVPFTGAAAEPGVWEAASHRSPSIRSECAVTVRVTGVNDAPSAVGDVVTNVTEASKIRVMVRPELAGTPLSLPSDPVPPPSPNPAHLIDNDTDVDADETWETLRLVGVMGTVHAIQGYSGAPGASPVTVHAPGHGLSTGTEILIANYGGHPSYNGYHVVTVVDADTLTIPRFFVDNDADKGVWVVLNDSNRYHAVTDVGATVDLTLRADSREDNLIYNASASSFLNGLAEGEVFTNRFYQAVVDSHGAIGIGPVDVAVVGLNDTPTALPDPAGLGALASLVSPSNTLADVLADGLDILYTLPPASCATGRIDVQTLDRTGALPGTLVLPDLWFTDEGTPIAIACAALLANDTDIDRIDVLSVAAVEAVSREGASLTLAGGQIVYDPTASDALQALARDERVIDTFYAAVSDAMTGGTVTSLVAVLVVGLNDTPVAQPDLIALSEDDALTFNPILWPAGDSASHDYDLDINGLLPDDRLTLIAVSNLITACEARVDIEAPLTAQYDARVSATLNQLADWQVCTDSFVYAISDNSFLFVVDDEFYVPADTAGKTLNVLANDRDLTPLASTLSIVEVGPTLSGGTVTIAPDGQSLVYSSPAGVACDDYFRYVVVSGAGNRRSARVLVRSVIPPLNGILCAAGDRFAVAAGETATLDVLANDNMLPEGGAGLTLSTNVIGSSIPGQPVLSGNAFVFAATNGQSALTFTYEVSAGGTSVARADVSAVVIDRRGTLDVQNDTASVAAGSADNALDVLANDNLVTGSTEHLRVAALLDAGSHGTASVNASATGLLYTPNAGFIGMEQLRYLAADGVGGTGTGVVTVIVGTIETVVDFFAVAATTNTAPVSLDVLANDRVQPYGAGALTLVSVSPAGSPIGALSVGGAGSRLEFVPSNVVGQADFVYLVADGSAQTATGTVTIATVPAGIYANTDRYVLRGGGSDYEFDVLANDRSYPDVNKVYVVTGIGTGAEAPSAGGSVSIVGNRLRYTPAAGFIGQERFTYTMSDSQITDSAWVTVTVSPGDMFANRDHFAVFFALEGGGSNAMAFTLPVTLNDRITPPLGQSVQITGLGVGTNAPDRGGAVSIGADGVSLVYRPAEVPATSYVERFTYEISDGTDRRASAVAEVRVINRVGLLSALAQDDAFTVGRNSLDNVLPLLRNDFARPGTADGWILTSVSSSAHGGSVSISNNAVRYSPPADFVGDDTFTYSVRDGLGGTGSAAVRVAVGALPTLPDLFAVVSGSVSNELDVLANDALTEAYADEYDLADVFGATHGGAVAVSPSNTVLYAPSPSYAGPYPYVETFFYSVADDAAGAVTGMARVVVHEQGSDGSSTTVTVVVEGRNDRPVIQNVMTNVAITDKQTARPFTGVTFVEVDQQTQEAVDVVVSLDDAAKGVLQSLGDFADLGGGSYGLTGVTAAHATAQIRELVFVPTENRIRVPTTETTHFTIVVTDNKSEPVVDTQTDVDVTAVNDAPVIFGTRAGQTVYAAVPIRLFSSVTITEVDDLAQQPLTVTVRMNAPTNGALRNLGSFAQVGSGVYVATNITAAAATVQLRAMEYLFGAGKVAFGAPQITTFQITVNDQFAPPVSDGQTSVVAYSPFEGTVEPTNVTVRASFGASVDIWKEFAVVGSPGANVNGIDSGSALIYRLVPGTTNTWSRWIQLQPATVEEGDRFGSSVAISEDMIAVGAIRDEAGSRSSGAVYLFQRNQGGSNSWGQVLRIAPTNLPVASEFGTALDLDVDRLAVGAPKATVLGAAEPPGAVFVYERNKGGAGAWGEVVRREPQGSTSLDFGRSVSLSGSQLVVGAPRNSAAVAAGEPRGAVFALSRQSGGADNWGFVQRVVDSNLTYEASFGFCVSVDGSTFGVGAPGAQGDNWPIGQVRLYKLNDDSNGWHSVALMSGYVDESVARFGYSVSVNKDFIMVGSPLHLASVGLGAVFLFRQDPLDVSKWNLVERLGRPAGSSVIDQYGASVSFKGDVAIVGAIDAQNLTYDYPGRAYIYRFKFNNAPVVASAVPDPFAEWNQPFAYTLPAQTFADPDVGDELAVQLSLPAGGYGLSAAGATVSGTPTTIGAIPVVARATDGSGASASDAFDVVVLLNGVYVEGTPRNRWNLAHFGADLADPLLQSTVWGGDANCDGDVLNNDREYAFGGDPTVGDCAGVVTIAQGAGSQVVVSYVRRTNDPALSYVLQGSAGLTPASWQNVQALVVGESVAPVDAALERVSQTLLVEPEAPVMFFRVIVLP